MILSPTPIADAGFARFKVCAGSGQNWPFSETVRVGNFRVGMNKENGFTTIELVAVIVLVGILAFSFSPRFTERTIELNGQVEQLAGDIRFAQSLSMTHGARYCIFFNAAQSQYQFRNSSCATAVAHPATGSTAYITLSNTSMALSNISGSYIEFDTKGKPYTFTAPSSNATITLSSSGGTRSVSVSPETGRVLVQ